MAKTIVPRPLPSSEHLHPLIYAAIIGLAAWLVLSVWAFFDSGAYEGLFDTVITGFILMAVGIPFLLWRTSRRNRAPDAAPTRAPAFRNWVSGRFETWTGPMKASDASIEILLPIAAVAFGMTAFGLVLHFTAGGAL